MYKLGLLFVAFSKLLFAVFIFVVFISFTAFNSVLAQQRTYGKAFNDTVAYRPNYTAISLNTSQTGIKFSLTSYVNVLWRGSSSDTIFFTVNRNRSYPVALAGIDTSTYITFNYPYGTIGDSLFFWTNSATASTRAFQIIVTQNRAQ